MNVSPCPDQSEIHDLFSGQIGYGEGSSVVEHLLSCEKCSVLADSIVASGEITALLGRAETQTFRTRETQVVDQLIELTKKLKLKRNVQDASEQTFVGTVEECAETAGGGHQTIGIAPEVTSFLKPAEQPDELGRLGDYRVLQVLGSGGMGVVYRAEDLRLRRQVALKVMKPVVAANPEARIRFLHEAEATAAIEHDNIVTIYQVGEDNGVPFFAMQLLKGESLQRRIEREGRLSEAEVLRIGSEIADGLHVAHARGLIHRDIKPDNIWLQEGNGRVRIVDFGLVRNSADETGLTQSGIVLGTPKYMAPEQAQGESVDARCDLFSLGSVLYRMASGRAPFEGTNLTATLIAVAHEDPRPLAEIAPELSKGLTEIITKLLHKDRSLRPASAAEVSHTLKGLQQKAESVLTQSEQKHTSPAEVESELAPKPFAAKSNHGANPPRARKMLAGLGGFAVLILMAVLVIKLRTKDGVVVIELNSTVPVTQVEIDGTEVKFQTDESGRTLTLAVPEGSHELVLKTSEGLSLTTELGQKPVQVETSETTKVRAWLEAPSNSKKNSTESAAMAADSKALKPTDHPTMKATTSPSADKTPAETKLGNWKPGPDMPWAEMQVPQLAEGNFVPGLIDRPAVFEGFRSWNIETRFSRSKMGTAEYSPDGQWLATGSIDGHIRIYDAKTLALKTLLPGLGIATGVVDLSWHPDSRRIAASCDGERVFRIWTLDGHVAYEKQTDYSSSYNAVQWMPDGQNLICAGRSVIEVRKPNGTLAKTLFSADQSACLHTAEVAVCANNHAEFACVQPDGVKIWNINSGDHRRIGDGPGKRIMIGHSIAWSSANIISIADSDGIVLYEGENHSTVRRLKCVNEPATVAWHPDGIHLAAWVFDRIAVVDAVRDEVSPRADWLEVLAHSSELPTGLEWSPDGKQIVAASGQLNICDGSLTRVTFSSGTKTQFTTGVSSHPTDDEFLTVSGATGSDILRWSSDGHFRERFVLPQKDVSLRGIRWNPAGSTFLAWGNDNSGGGVWLGNRGETIREVVAERCSSGTWNPAGDLAALGFDSGKICIIKATGELVQELQLETKETAHVAWSSKNNLVAQAGKQFFRIDTDGTEFRAKRLTEVAIPFEGTFLPRWNVAGSFIDTWNGGGTSIRVPADGDSPATTNEHCVPAAWNPAGTAALCVVEPNACLSLHSIDNKLLRRRGTNGAHYWNAADYLPSGNLILVGNDQGLVSGVDPETLLPEWTAAILPDNKTVTISAAGQFIDGDQKAADEQLVYVTVDTTGKYQTLTRDEFEAIIDLSQSKNTTPRE